MLLRPPISTLTNTLCPYTTLLRSIGMRRMHLDAVIAIKARACCGGAELGDDRLDLRRRQAIDGLAPARPGDLQEMNDLRHHLAVGGDRKSTRLNSSP